MPLPDGDTSKVIEGEAGATLCGVRAGATPGENEDCVLQGRQSCFGLSRTTTRLSCLLDTRFDPGR